MPRRPNPVVQERPEERWLREEQTRRNVQALEAEQDGRLDDAIALYERNVAEGFAGDWPYGHLVAIYERRGAYGEAARVLRRGIAVFEASTIRTPQDRRSIIRAFKKRLGLVERRIRAAEGDA